MIKFLQKTVCLVLFTIFSMSILHAQDVNPIKNLSGNCNNVGKITLNWVKPDPHEVDGFWLTWSSDEILYTIGAGMDGDMISAARFTAADMSSKGVTAGDKIVQMQIVVNKQGCSDITLKVWQGGSFIVIPFLELVIANPGTLHVDQSVDLSIIGTNWSTIPLAQPYLISTSSELWMGFSVTASSSAYPLGYDPGPHINNKSDLISVNEQWTTLSRATDPPMSLSACIKAFVTKHDMLFVTRYDVYKDGVKVGETTSTNYTIEDMLPGEYNFCVKAVYNNAAQSENVCATIVCNEVCDPVKELVVVYSTECDKATVAWSAPTTAFQPKFNVYRDDTMIAEAIEETIFVDDSFDGTVGYTWSVETVCLTMSSSKVSQSMPHCYVGIDETISDVFIYPNPASQTVTIQVNQFQKVEIYNPVGQLIEVKNNPVVDVSNYSPGIYFFKVYDFYGIFSIKRVTVMR